MKQGWKIVKIGDLSDVITKGTTPTSVGFDFVEEGINFVKVESITENGQFIPNKLAHITASCHDFLKRSQLKKGDILFSIAGALGRTALVTENILPANTNQALSIIRLKKSNTVLPEFILKALATGIVLDQVQKFKGGVAQQNLSLAQIQSFEIPLPPLPEQQRLVTILDEVFAALATAKENGYAFDGKDFETDFKGKNPIVLTPGNFSENSKLYFNEKNTKRCSGKYPAEYRFNKGDLVVVMTDLSSQMKILGKPALIECENVLHNQRIGRFIFLADLLDKFYLYYYLQTQSYSSKIKETATGTMVRHTAPKRILDNVISFPPLPEQRAIVAKLDALSVETKKLEAIYQQKLANLEELKKSVLRKAFRGEI